MPFARAEEHRPFTEMKGGCENFAKDLKREFSLWDKASTKIAATPAVGASAALPVGTKVSLGLFNEPEVKLAAKPEKKFESDKPSFAGVGNVVVPVDGKYIFALGKRIWLDLVDLETKQVVKASSFEMQMGCAKIFKAIEFKLNAKNKYALQISSSPDKNVDLLITPVK